MTKDLLNNAGTSGLIIKSTASGTGSLISSSANVSATVERVITKNLKWHFLSSPVTAQPIWPEFAPTPSGSTLTFGTSPWGWDFYYWNPKALTASELYWVNLRQDNAGTYNARTIDASGNIAGFGPAIPDFTVGRGYLAAYNANWSPATNSPETHLFTGILNYGTVVKAIIKDANPYNLIGNPYPSAIDWQSAGWSNQRDVLVSSGSGYDYWIYNDIDANYGVFNSATGTGTHGTTRYIAPMQGFFVQANTSGNLTMSNVQVHASQTWLKDVLDSDNLLHLKLTTSANTFNDEMIVAVNPAMENGGSPKFWSMDSEAPELYSIKKGINYSIDWQPSVDETSFVAIGIKAGLQATFTLDATGVSNFFFAKSIILEDLKTGSTQELKNNPSYTFTANPADNPERFHLHFGGPFGINNHGIQPDFTIFSFDNSVYIQNISGKILDGTVYICNILGQKIIEKRVMDQRTMIVLDAPAGCYIVTFVTNNQTYCKKVFIH